MNPQAEINLHAAMNVRFTRPNRPHRLAALAATALVALTVSAAEAPANGERVVKDPKFESVALSRNGSIDIVEATAGRRGTTIEHTITMRSKVRPASKKERPSVTINTKGGRRSAFEFIVFGSTIFEVPKKGQPVALGASTVNAKKRTWTYEFDASEIPELPASYGWAAITQKGPKIADIAPDSGYADSPR